MAATPRAAAVGSQPGAAVAPRSALLLLVVGVVLGVTHHAASGGWAVQSPPPFPPPPPPPPPPPHQPVAAPPAASGERQGWAEESDGSEDVNIRDYPLDPFPQAPCLDTCVSLAEAGVPDRSLAPPVLHPVIAARLRVKVLVQGTGGGGVGAPYIPRARDACTRYYHRDVACAAGEPWRLVVAIAAAVHTRPELEPGAQALLTDLAPSLRAGLDPAFAYRLYLAYDVIDPLYGSVEGRAAASLALLTAANAGATDGVRCLAGAPAGTTLPPLTSVHWVPCDDCPGYPARAQSRAATAAVLEGAEYVLRINDDTRLPPTGAWTAAYIAALLTQSQLPNFGVVGPYEPDALPGVLRLHFTHRTHTRIFGAHYPATLPDISADVWMTKVYEQYNATRISPAFAFTSGTRPPQWKAHEGVKVRTDLMLVALRAAERQVDTYAGSFPPIALRLFFKVTMDLQLPE